MNACLDYQHNITCQKNFILLMEYGGCVPNCHTWSQHNEIMINTLKVTGVAFSSIGIVLVSLAVVSSIIQKKSMNMYSIYVYNTIHLSNA